MKVLVLGNGGREHALAWKIGQSPQCEKIYLHPGNAGSIRAGLEPLPSLSPQADAAQIAGKAKDLGVSLVVIGPEVLLADGYADFLRTEGLNVVGPGKIAAQLETSKAFAKEFMQRAEVPTADFLVAESDKELLNLLQDRQSWPVVLKLDGLAAGKGVVIADSFADAENFAEAVWGRWEFGRAHHRVVVEEFIVGKELSLIGLCDGSQFIALSSATDFKRIGDGNTGPNTGGMGSLSPSPLYTPELEKVVRETVIDRILAQMKKESIEYRGALYIGLMIDDEGRPFVLEFNVRFGDPETQALVLRLDSDFIEVLDHTARGMLKLCPRPTWSSRVSLYVVAASEGYPTRPVLGDAISGIEAVHPSTQVFFSGVKESEGKLVTAGGRVLGLGTTAETFDIARSQIYKDLRRVDWRGIQFRSDIGATP